MGSTETFNPFDLLKPLIVILVVAGVPYLILNIIHKIQKLKEKHSK